MAGATHVSAPRKIAVSLDFIDTPQIEVEVQDYFTQDGAGWVCCWVVMNPVDGRLDLYREQSSHYALTRLPTTEALIQWAEDITVHQEKRLVGLHQAMDRFIMKYSKSERNLPMVGGPSQFGPKNPRLISAAEISCPQSSSTQLPRQDSLRPGIVR